MELKSGSLAPARQESDLHTIRRSQLNANLYPEVTRTMTRVANLIQFMLFGAAAKHNNMHFRDFDQLKFYFTICDPSTHSIRII